LPAVQRSRRRILVVDDYADIRTLVTAVLEAEGHEVIQAANGHEAVRQERDLEPDLVVLDLTMPVMDGWETAARIRERSRVAVLFLTARAEDCERRRARHVGAARFMLKPFDRHELVETVTALLDPRSGSTQRTS
jgi:DNA-binding response OmpR family regulator